MSASPEQAPNISRITLRSTVRHSDLLAVGQIVRSSGYFSEEEIETAVELVEDAILDGPFSHYLFIFAEIDRRVAAYACFGPIPLTRSSFDLYWIAVTEQFRRHGIGSIIMEQTENEIKRLGGTRIYVDTSGRAQYASTRAFYEKRGYRKEAVLENFYTPGDDKIIYCLNLAGPNSSNETEAA